MRVIEKMGKFDEPPAIRGEREKERESSSMKGM